jgi:uncharacterized membrane protein
VQFAVPLPSWALPLIALALIALAALAYRGAAGISREQRALLVALRAAALALIVICLLRPMVLLTPRDRQDGVVAVLVDTSRSMGIADADGMTRLERAGALLTRELVPALSSRFRVESFAFGDRVALAADTALVATADRTDLADAVKSTAERLRGAGLSAIVVLSDGNDTSGTDLGAAGAAAGVPVIAVGLGSRDGVDREVASLASGQSGLDASLVDLTATIVTRGGRGPVNVRLLQNGQVVERRALTPAADGAPMRASFTVAPDRTTPTVYTVDLPDGGQEITAANNSARILVAPPGRRRLVLSLEGAPGFEPTFLKRAWADDPSLEVDAAVRKGRNENGADTFFVQAGATRSSALAAGFPPSREQLYVYDAVVLTDYELHLLTREQQEWLRGFVSERGGGLLFMGPRTFDPNGLANSPLEDLLPLRLSDGASVVRVAAQPGAERFRVRPTADGARHPIMRIGATDDDARARWASLPSLAGVVELSTVRPGAAVLAVAEDNGREAPVVAVQRFGAGRTALFAGQASWRWKMMRPSSDGSYDRFWRQAARWLTAEALDPLAITPPGAALPGDPVALSIVARTPEFTPSAGDQLQVRVQTPSGETTTITPALTDPARGLYTAQVPAAEPGIYRAEVTRIGGGPPARAETRWLVGGLDREMADPRLNDAGLRGLAEASGGRFVADASGEAIAALARDAARLADRPPEWRDAWHTGWMFAAIVLLVSAEWGLRRRWGLR